MKACLQLQPRVLFQRETIYLLQFTLYFAINVVEVDFLLAVELYFIEVTLEINICFAHFHFNRLTNIPFTLHQYKYVTSTFHRV